MFTFRFMWMWRKTQMFPYHQSSYNKINSGTYLSTFDVKSSSNEFRVSISTSKHDHVIIIPLTVLEVQTRSRLGSSLLFSRIIYILCVQIIFGYVKGSQYLLWNENQFIKIWKSFFITETQTISKQTNSVKLCLLYFFYQNHKPLYQKKTGLLQAMAVLCPGKLPHLSMGQEAGRLLSKNFFPMIWCHIFTP